MFSKEDELKLKKLGSQWLGDLALFVPKGYEANYLSSELVANEENLLELELKSFKKEPKLYRILGYSPRFDKEIELVYFNYQPYQIEALKAKSSHYLKGKLQAGFRLQLLQPKIITEIDTIKCNYATTALKNKTIRELLERLITEESLSSLGISQKYIKPLLTIHFPDIAFAAMYKKHGGFFGIYLEALKFCEIFFHLHRLSKKRRDFEALEIITKSPKEFIDSLPFVLTNDQKCSISDIQRDISSKSAAKRVVVGDVGCGKTMVILAAAFMAHPKKSILMAPTTILANQLYEEANKYLPKEMGIALITQESREKSLHTAHFLIGTHALLYTELPDAAIVMVDEQHRFGTKQRETLSKFFEKDGKKPHFLQFSATPIPRTLAMIESALVDISFIKELPFKKEIETRIIDKSHFKELLAHIQNEIAKGHQTIIVYPLVEESESINYMSIAEAEAFWKKNFESVYVTHGKDKEKAKVLLDFREKGSILLATTLIEVGISLPRLSTIVIVGAERLGLATLHQLRGRVGRYGEKGFCYLYSNSPKNERLSEFATTQSGFEIAELDLKYRNSGDMLSGSVQSGKSFRWIDLALDGEIVVEAKASLESLLL